MEPKELHDLVGWQVHTVSLWFVKRKKYTCYNQRNVYTTCMQIGLP